jgi:hypothetical protein
MINFIKELIDRLRKEKPDFFKRLQKVAVVLVVIFFAISYANKLFFYLELNYEIPAKIVAVADKLCQLFIVLFGFSFLPNKDKPINND